MVRLEKRDDRLYFFGGTYDVRHKIKAIGGRWDADARGWWVPASKRQQAESLVAKLGGEAPAPAPAPATTQPETIYAFGTPKRTQRTNRKGDHCQRCGSWCAAGTGALIFCPEDSGCMEHHDHSGYHVQCLDAAACAAAQQQRKEERAKRAEEAKRIKATQEAAIAGYHETVKRETAGLVATWVRVELRGEETNVASLRIGTSHDLYRGAAKHDGSVVMRESVYAYDDFRETTWASQRVVDMAILRAAENSAVHFSIQKIRARLADEAQAKYVDADQRRYLELVGW